MTDGVALTRTRDRHRRRYPELVDNGQAKLMVLGSEIFGRWDPEALRALSVLAANKAQEAPELVRRSAGLAWHRRWLAMLSVAAQTALVETLIRPGNPYLTEHAGDVPPLGDVLTLQPELDPPEHSRLR